MPSQATQCFTSATVSISSVAETVATVETGTATPLAVVGATVAAVVVVDAVAGAVVASAALAVGVGNRRRSGLVVVFVAELPEGNSRGGCYV